MLLLNSLLLGLDAFNVTHSAIKVAEICSSALGLNAFNVTHAAIK